MYKNNQAHILEMSGYADILSTIAVSALKKQTINPA